MNSSSSHFHHSFHIPQFPQNNNNNNNVVVDQRSVLENYKTKNPNTNNYSFGRNNNNVNVVDHHIHRFLENPQTGSNPSSSHHSFMDNKHLHQQQQRYSFSNKENNSNLLNTTIQPQTNNNHIRIKKITFILSSARNHHNNDVDGKKLQKEPHYSCHVCNKVFSSNKALYGHMRWHPQKGSKKGNTESSFLEQNKDKNKKKNNNYDVDQGHLSAIDLSNNFPPTSYKTNKRGKPNRVVIDEDACNAAQVLLDMSRGKFLNFDVNNSRDGKRLKLPV